jgi:hypothetical protein
LLRALGNPPDQAVRSTLSKGVHVWFWLREQMAINPLRARVQRLMAQEGLQEESGQIEIFPSAGRRLRLPLGPGSVLLDENLDPQHVVLDHRGRHHRDSVASIWQIVASARKLCTLPAPSAQTSILTGGSALVTGREETNRPYPANEGNGPNSAWDEDIRSIARGVTAPGRRFEESRRLLFDLFIRRGLSFDEALAIFERWLVEGQHRSKDLAANPERTIGQMLREARARLRSLQSRLDAGTLTRPRRAAANRGSLDFVLDLLMRNTDAKPWRALAKSQVTPLDRELIAKVEPDWLRDRLEVLIGALRFGEVIGGRRADWGMSRTALRRIAGGKPPPKTLVRLPTGLVARGRTAYVLLLSAAEGLRLVTQRSRPIKGRAVRRFEVNLPSEEAFGRTAAASTPPNTMIEDIPAPAGAGSP